jgi:hypothetical protein
MEIQKKIKCTSCGTILTVYEGSTSECTCKKVMILEGHIQGTVGTDYIDVSPKLLCE